MNGQSVAAYGLRIAARLAPIAGLLAIWQLAVSGGLANPDCLPSPVVIAAAGIDLIRSGELWSNLALTLATSFGGLAIATVVGVPLGMLMAKSAVANSIFGPLVKATYSLPKTALVPLFFGVASRPLFRSPSIGMPRKLVPPLPMMSPCDR